MFATVHQKHRHYNVDYRVGSTHRARETFSLALWLHSISIDIYGQNPPYQ